MATPIELYEEFRKISLAGDEMAAKKFLEDHIAEFPEQERNEILLAMFEDSVLKAADAIEEDVLLKQQGLAALEELEAAKKDIDNEIRIEELKDQLGAK